MNWFADQIHAAGLLCDAMHERFTANAPPTHAEFQPHADVCEKCGALRAAMLLSFGDRLVTNPADKLLRGRLH